MRQMKRRITAFLMAVIMVAAVITTGGFEDNTDVARAEVTTPVAAHGKLSVSGTQLVDQYGQAFQIRGVSTHGLQWFAQYNNQDAYQTLRDDWGANCIRLAMYTENGGYCAGNASTMKQEVEKGVQYATNLGMYAIIDWHILSDGNPQKYKTQAKSFFGEMASKYKDYDNVIYEICNEPNNCSWSDIKSYAQEVIQVIRQFDKDAIIIVGTPTWSQLGSQGHLYEPADNPITGYSNIMYSFHFYASDSDHNQWLTEKIGTAISKGLPVFVTEFGLSEASGDGKVDLTKAKEWLQRCDNYNVSYCAWSLSNDWRSSSIIKSSCSKTSGWTTDDLTTAGNYLRDWYRARMGTDADSIINSPEVDNLAQDVSVTYSTHVQTFGWQSYVADGKMSGTAGLSKRLEGIKIKVEGNDNLGIRYKTHVQTYGWQDWVADDRMSGTSGESKRLEAICIELTGADKDKYDIYYRVHAQSYGWLDWAKNGECAGTEGYSKRLEAINIVIVPKGADPGVSTERCFVTPYGGDINYATHVQTYGWRDFTADGASNGSWGESKRLEGIKIKLNKDLSGSVLYQTHVQTYGWETDWKKDGEMSGTSGESKRLEAIRIKLDGEVAEQYDVYYRVHVQTYGWLDWACNGEMSGTSGLSRRLEAIEIKLVPKGEAAPGSTERPFIEG